MLRRFLVIRQIVSCVCLPLAGGVELCLHLLSTNSSGCQQKLNCGCCCGCILENFNVIVDVADFLPVVHDNEDAFTTTETAVVASVMFVKSICFGMKIGFFLISLRGLSIAFCNVLMTSSSSGDLLHLLLPRLLLCGRTLVLSACCNTFLARTDLSPLSPTRSFNTSLSTLIARIGFSGRIASLICSNNQTTTLPAVGTALSWVLGVPSLAVLLHGHLGPVPACFLFLHVHLARVSSNLLLTLGPGTCFIVVSGEPSAHTRG